MKVHYTNNGKVKITMSNYIEGMLCELPKCMDGVATSPAGNHLNDKDGEMFHHKVAKLLFLCKRARPICRRQWHSSQQG
jgi:hypothetical protein